MLCLTIISDIQNNINFMLYIAIFNEFEFRVSNDDEIKFFFIKKESYMIKFEN